MMQSLAAATKILIVDDVPDNLRLLSRMLELQHYSVRKALSGKMALQSVQRDPPDLILLDINMPDMNGYQVCQQLKASDATSHIPIIFISALDQVNSKVQAFAVGGQDYITKPFEELEVLARIRNQLLIQQQQQQLQEQKSRLLQQNCQLEQEIQARQQAEMQVRHLNADLERQIQARTLELQQALKFAATLKSISDKIRDSLDQHQILQTAVEELAIALEVCACHIVLHGASRQSGILNYQSVSSETGFAEELLRLSQTIGGDESPQPCVALCQIPAAPEAKRVAMLSCPIFDPQLLECALGSLGLFRDPDTEFSDLEIHLVKQVTTQCAIALRQARLYAAAQEQIQALQRLNQLKDDFLSTISHELRTPIASMKMVLKLLATMTDQGRILAEELSKPTLPQNKAVEYLTILQEECDRELALVEDLLALQHLESETSPLDQVSLNLRDWIFHVTEAFEIRTRNHQQQLQIHLAANLPTLELNFQGLRRVLTELLSNACKYTPAGETISLNAQVTGNPQSLELIVTNTGVEIAPDELPRVFDKFYRIPSNDPWKHGGTGLGLALAKKMVERMGGTISAASDPTSTRFIVRIPCPSTAPHLAVPSGINTDTN